MKRLLPYFLLITFWLLIPVYFHSATQYRNIILATNLLISLQCKDPILLEMMYKYLNTISIDRIYTIIGTILHVAAGIVAIVHFRKERPVLVMLLVVTLLGVALSAVAFYYLH